MPVEPVPLSGLVVALQANYCWVDLAQPGPGGQRRLLCTRRTRLAKSGQSICVGDRVHLDGIDWPSGRGAIAAVEPRWGLLSRPAVANVSLVVVVVALAEPALDPLQLTRFLITAEANGQPVLPVFSKADLLPVAVVESWCARVAGWGYDPLAVSTQRGQGLEALRQRLSQPGLAVVCGPSGVGKSSLLNGLRPELDLRVAPVSGRLQRGRHTTRHVELFALAPGALVADTPGFNRPELPADPALLAALFPEVRQRLAGASCRFSDCLHQGEPGCAVGCDWERHRWYSDCLETMQLEQERLERQGNRGERPGQRLRAGRLEPRLDPQLRQLSRRRQRQQAWREGGDGEGPPLTPPDPAG
jgi:ribosome biogenesis GTPase / thiamine phosphate phosphatase